MPACKRGHTSPRIPNGGEKTRCRECKNLLSRLRYAGNPDKDKRYAINRQWVLANQDKVKAIQKRYRAKNLDVARKRCRIWAAKDPVKRLERQRKYYATNSKKVIAAVMRRKAAKLKAVPQWADLSKIKTIYQNCPDGYQVDHIVPLRGKNVCGLHVENNLQYLTVSENSSKRNKFLVNL